MLTFIAAIFVFGLLIISHEFGHFITAKSAGVKVLEFSVGMGPKILGFKKKETNYSLRAFPIGGYVRMLGEEGESDDPRAFCNAATWRRMIIIVAGAFMNFIIAIVLFSMVRYNVGVYKPIVGGIETGYPAVQSGIKVDDKIYAVNGKTIKKWDQFTTFVSENKNKPITITIIRNNKTKNVIVKPIYNKAESRYMIGISPKVVKGNIGESISNGFTETFSSIKQMLTILKSALQGKLSTNDLGGPVLIVKLSGEAAKLGIWQLLMFTAFLSINLGIINLIPFPALDGGWVIILLIEGLTRKKIDENKIGIVNMVGFAVLITFTIWITFKDILRLNSF